ncbi:right-handed parallel beta-helix repeat-containing protein [Halobacillus sp. BAB-2008]|uniref:right-handed parallel beta-helix repeat-containing protein n=1 Tax=Halobacillus sp. BAB-2008 TaxID=1246484 RepID=UPI0002A4FBE5|nr:right-handed parallel beta-helix repeat-containing protein [Halobacillus sp. BAB-2008]ELK48585.1 endopygalactorunase-like protein [Halobacillus sp. BAB-2008]
MKHLITWVILTMSLYLLSVFSVHAEESLTTLKEIQEEIDRVSRNGGGTVTLPAETIVLSESIRLKSNVHLKGQGVGKTVLTMNPVQVDGSLNPNKILLADRISNVEVSDITFDGAKESRKELINSGFSHTMSFAYVDGLSIHDVEVVDSVDASIALWYVSNGTIKNNVIRDSGSNGILGMQETHDIEVRNNTIDHTDNQNGIFFMYQGDSTYNILIEGNTVRNVADYAIEVGHTTHKPGDAPHRNITVRNNTIVNAFCTGIGFRTVSNGVIEGNTITNYAEHNDYGCNAVFVEGRVSLNSEVDIKNNTMTQTYPKVTEQRFPYQQAVYVTGMRDMDITGNTIQDSWNDSIYVLASFFEGRTPDFPDGRRLYKDIRITGNTILNSEKSGVHFDSYPSSGNAVSNNTILRSGGDAVLVEGDAQRVTVSDNILTEETPEPGENLWTKPTSFNPLPRYFPPTNRQIFDAGMYEVSFRAKSASSAALNLYVQDRRKLNENIRLTSDWKNYAFSFNSEDPDELLFWDKDISADIQIEGIFLKKIGGEEPVELPEEVVEAVERLKQLAASKEEEAVQVSNILIQIIDLLD